jgi:hypothetical protein
MLLFPFYTARGISMFTHIFKYKAFLQELSEFLNC